MQATGRLGPRQARLEARRELQVPRRVRIWPLMPAKGSPRRTPQEQ